MIDKVRNEDQSKWASKAEKYRNVGNSVFGGVERRGLCNTEKRVRD